MTALEKFAGELAGIVYSGQPKDVVLAEVSKRVRCVLDAHREDRGRDRVEGLGDGWLTPREGEEPCEGRVTGALTGRCPRTGHSCLGALVGNPGHFSAGHLVGQAIREALEGKVGQKEFRSKLLEILERPPEDQLIGG